METKSYAKYAKKIIIGLAAVCIALALITTNNVATMMAVMSSRKTAPAASGSGSDVVAQQDSQQPSGGSSTSSTPVSGGSSTSSTPVSGGSSTSSTPVSGGSSTSTDSGSTATPADNGGSTASADDKAEPANNDKPADAGEQKKDEGNKDAAPTGEMTKEQVVDLYVKSLNNAKAKAGKVMLLKDGALNYQEIFEAGAFSSFGPMLKAFFKLEDVNSESSRDELPPRGINCNLNAANVESATAKEENGVYTVEILLKDSNNPVAGDGGVGAVTNIISQDQITGGVEGIPGITLSNINLLYTQVKITATIDKETGNLTHVIADAPSILSLDAKAVVMSINGARVGIETYSEFSVEY